MTDDKAKKDTLKLGSGGKLSLTKTVDAGMVKQNFTHGRSKSVTVEVRKTRTYNLGAGGKSDKSGAASVAIEDDSMRNLTAGEREARMKALKIAEEENARRAKEEKDAEQASEEEKAAGQNKPEAAAKRTSRAGNDGVVLAPSLKAKKEVEVIPPAEIAAPAKQHHGRTPHPEKKPEETTDATADKGKLKLKGGKERRSSGKLTITQALGGYDDQRVRSLASIRRQREKVKKTSLGDGQPQEKVVREVVIPEAITVQELANRMAERSVDVIKALMKLGMMVTVTQSIDADTAELVVGEFGHKFKRVTEGDVENILMDETQDAPETLKPRPPVVTVMGHVDHGKTSLLDALRSTDVVAKEAGGITQHIGAYQVKLGEQAVTFLDTPGHEAFTAMRLRGAKSTDIVVLVVAADDGIMEQTKEAISHARAAEVPIIVAVNKIDKPDADPNRVKNELMQAELIPEEFGGDVQVVEVSAKERTNLDKLVEQILLQSEVLELKANPDREGRGVVIESRLDQGRGIVATLLVQKGTLRVADIVVAGAAYGKVRALVSDKGDDIEEATPGMPVEILGLSQAPEAGDVFSAVDSEKTAREIAEYRQQRMRTQQSALNARTMDQLFGEAQSGLKELPVIIRGDVQGSVEAIASSISKFNNEEVNVKLLHTAVGAISESDITLAKATNAIIIAFNVRAGGKAREMAAREQVEVRYYSVIYNVVDDIKAALSGLLSPTVKENFIGYAEIREVFNITKSGKVAGCYVTEGLVKRGAKVRLLRDNVVIHEGTLKTLKRFKDEVKEVKNGYECGMAFENYEDIRVGDMIEAFELTEEARTVE